MREDLLGYVIGALDGAEHDHIKHRLDEDPRLRQELNELEQRLTPLQAERWYCEPDVGLAERACDAIWRQCDNGSDHHQIHRRPSELAIAHRNERAAGQSSWSLADFVVTAGIVVAVSMLFFPTIANSRHQARILGCQSHLRELGLALETYSRNNNNRLPEIPAQGNLAVAGAFVPILVDAGLINDKNAQCLVCPDSELAKLQDPGKPPNMRMVIHASGEELARLQKRMGGSFAYVLGYIDANDQLRPTRSEGRSRFAVMADVPGNAETGTLTPNHAGKGFNVLFEDGHVEFRTVARIDGPLGDDVFHNDHGLRQAGVHKHDSVLGSSATPPLPRVLTNYGR